MTRKRYTPEQIIRKLRESEVMISQGKRISQASHQIGIVDQTYYNCLPSFEIMNLPIGYSFDSGFIRIVLLNVLITPMAFFTTVLFLCALLF